MKEREEILDSLKEWAMPRRDLLAMLLYGSYGKNQQTGESNLDLALLYRAGSEPAFRDDWEMQFALSQLLDTSLDLVIFNGSSDVLMNEILEYDNRFYTSDFTQTTLYECYAMSRYCDFVYSRVENPA